MTADVLLEVARLDDHDAVKLQASGLDRPDDPEASPVGGLGVRCRASRERECRSATGSRRSPPSTLQEVLPHPVGMILAPDDHGNETIVELLGERSGFGLDALDDLLRRETTDNFNRTSRPAAQRSVPPLAAR